MQACKHAWAHSSSRVRVLNRRFCAHVGSPFGGFFGNCGVACGVAVCLRWPRETSKLRAQLPAWRSRPDLHLISIGSARNVNVIRRPGSASDPYLRARFLRAASPCKLFFRCLFCEEQDAAAGTATPAVSLLERGGLLPTAAPKVLCACKRQEYAVCMLKTLSTRWILACLPPLTPPARARCRVRAN
eukprot:5576453-Pleurochrysis_carterae.AAC.2